MSLARGWVEKPGSSPPRRPGMYYEDMARAQESTTRLKYLTVELYVDVGSIPHSREDASWNIAYKAAELLGRRGDALAFLGKHMAKVIGDNYVAYLFGVDNVTLVIRLMVLWGSMRRIVEQLLGALATVMNASLEEVKSYTF